VRNRFTKPLLSTTCAPYALELKAGDAIAALRESLKPEVGLCTLNPKP
jgi:hypothetical protein